LNTIPLIFGTKLGLDCHCEWLTLNHTPCSRYNLAYGQNSVNFAFSSGNSVLILLSTQQIDDTVGVMRDNINKVSQRGERLDSLQDKTDNLAVSAQGFRRGANRVRKQMWWKVTLQFEGLFITLDKLTLLRI